MSEALRFQKYACGPGDHDAETLNELYSELVYVTQSLGKGVRRLARYPGSDFILPPPLAEYTLPDTKLRTKLKSEQLIVARHMQMGEAAHSLQVIESNTTLNDDRYNRGRVFYRFTWSGSEVLEAQQIELTINADARSIFESLESSQGAAVALFQQAETTRRARISMLEQHNIENLLHRTEQFGEELRTQFGVTEVEEVA
jgi:hypothetical protein